MDKKDDSLTEQAVEKVTGKQSPPRSDKEYCSSCSKPLGNSADGKCHECGGETYRAGRERTRNRRQSLWRGLIGW